MEDQEDEKRRKVEIVSVEKNKNPVMSGIFEIFEKDFMIQEYWKMIKW
jgi:hypothetical protein